MISRRQLIGCGIAASSLGIAVRLAGAGEPLAPPASPLALLVVDERFELADRIAARYSPDIPRVALPRDLLDLWHRRIAPALQARGHALGGVTTERGFFLLHTLAADHRLRVLSRNVHAARRGVHEPLVSWVLGRGKG
jgi:hypothetical protein